MGAGQDHRRRPGPAARPRVQRLSPDAPARRTLRVDAARLGRWVAGFAERHGEVSAEPGDGTVVLRAADGAVAVLHAPFPSGAAGPDDGPADRPAGGDPVAALVAGALADRTVAVLLVRRGGYACAVVRGKAVTASKVGSRYVQGRTAAGGWSQQRFARRREGQAKALVAAVAEVAARVLLPAGAVVLATGGDRPLVEQVLADPRLAPLARLPRATHLEVGDPKSDVVRALPARLREIRIELTEP